MGTSKGFSCAIAAAIMCLGLMLPAAFGTTYYMATTANGGSDSNAGTQAAPWATLVHAFTVMASHDTLMIGDGTYSGDSNTIDEYSGHQPPSGSAGNFTVIRAQNIPGQNGVAVNQPLKVRFDPTAGIHVGGAGGGVCTYVKFLGIRFEDTCTYVGWDHLYFKQCAFEGTQDGNNATMCLDGAYNLVEDCVAWGKGRYKMMTWTPNYGTFGYNVFRRCVARQDWTTPDDSDDNDPCAVFCSYHNLGTCMLNCISIDGDTPTNWPAWTVAPTSGSCISGSFLSVVDPGDQVTFIGDIAVNTAQEVVNLRQESAGHIVTDCAGAKVAGGFEIPCGVTVNRVTLVNANTNNFTWRGQSQLNSVEGANLGWEWWDYGPAIMSNFIFRDVPGNSGTGVSTDHCDMYNVTTPVNTPTYTYDPFTNGLMYLPRIEAGSTLATAGSGGGQVGARIVNKIGADGTFYGDANWNTEQDPLWPFPLQDWIQAEMRTTMITDQNFLNNVNLNRGFCATGQNLTDYIWSWFGNTSPFAGLNIQTSSLPADTINVAYNQTLTAAGGTAPYTWAISSGSLPAGLSLNASSGVISGTPTATGTSSFTARVTDNTSATATRALSIAINPAPSITTSSLPSGTAGAAYPSTTLGATGGTTPYSWAIQAGSLPAGLSLVAGTGAITGTPTASGTSSFTAKVTDNVAATATKALSIVINAALSITTSSLPGGTVGTAYSQTLAATGGVTPYTWAVFSGSLPAGLSLNSSTGAITGTPSASGTSNFTARVTDNAGATATKALSIAISLAPTSATYLFAVTDSETTTTSTSYVNKTALSFTPTASDTWVILGFAETKGSSTSYSTNVQLTVDGAVAQDTTLRPKNATDYQSFVGMKVVTLSAAAHTLNIDYSSSSASGTAYIRYARIVAIRQASLVMASADEGDAGHDITTTMTDYVSQSFTPATAGDYLLIWSTAANGNTTTYATNIEARLNGTAQDTCSVRNNNASNYVTFVSFQVATNLPASAQTISLAAAKASGSSAVHHVKRSRVAAIRLTGGRYASYQTNSSDTESTTTSTTFQNKLTKPWTPGAAGNWAVLTSFRMTNSSASYSTEAQVTVDDSTTSAQPLKRIQNATDYLPMGSVDVRSLTAAAHHMDVNYRSANASGTAKIKYARFVGLPLDGGAASLSITTSSLPNGQIGVGYSQTLAATGGQTPYTWSIASGSLPAGLSLVSSTGAITGTPTASGTSSFTAQVTDALSATATQALSITIPADLSVTTSSLPGGVVGTAYSQSLAATGGVTPYSWSLASGSLPAGLSLTSGGAISGTPTASGASSFTVQVTDSQSPADTATKALSITVISGLTITTSSLPADTVGVAYNQTLAASGGTTPYTWSLQAGSLPAGLSLVAGTGAITGTPTASGTSSFTAKVTDNVAATATKALSVTINAAVSITTASLPADTVNIAYSQTLSAGGGTGALTWSLQAGSLPAGLSLVAGTGAITGTPTTAGTSNFTAKATDTVGASATKALSIVINAAVTITTASLPADTVGIAYSQTLAATGGTGTLTWSLASGSLPAGLSLVAGTGAITGTPTAAGTSNFTAQATDTVGATATKALSIAINAAVTITTSSLPADTINFAYPSTTLAATGGTGALTWSIQSGTLPAGLSLVAGTGAITGTPTASGTSSFTAKATDTLGASGTKALSIVINAAPSITTTSLPNGTVGTAYSQTLAATGGTTPLTWSIQSGSLPAGLSLVASTGVISGTPTASGTSSFTAKVTDNVSATDTKALSIIVTSGGGTSATYQFTASDTEANTTSTDWVNKAMMTFTPSAADNWLVFAFAEIKNSGAGYLTGVRFTIDGAVAQDSTVAPMATTDYQSFAGIKVLNLSAASHAFNIDFKTSNASGTAYVRAARIVAIRQSALELYSADSGDTPQTLTSTLTNYANVSWTCPTTTNYLAIWSAEFTANTTSYYTNIQGEIAGGTVDQTSVCSTNTGDYYTFLAAKTFSATANTQWSVTTAAAMQSGSTGTHQILRARCAAFNLDTGRFASFVMSRNDTEATTTSTAWQQRLSTTVTVAPPTQDWFILGTWRLTNSSTSYSSEGMMQLNGATTEADSMRMPNNTNDYFGCSGVDVRTLSTGANTVVIDYRTGNASGTAKVRNVHFMALPLN